MPCNSNIASSGRRVKSHVFDMLLANVQRHHAPSACNKSPTPSIQVKFHHKEYKGFHRGRKERFFILRFSLLPCALRITPCVLVSCLEYPCLKGKAHYAAS